MIAAITTCACILPVQAFAADNTTHDSSVAYSVSAKFTMTISDSVRISDGTGTVSVGASDVLANETKKLSVKLTGALNHDSTNFRLKTGTQTYLNYTITKAGETVALGGEVLAVPAGSTSGSTTLTLTPSTATVSGDYADTLTFTAGIE